MSHFALATLLIGAASIAGAPNELRTQPDDDPEPLIERLYDLITFKGGTVPDWDEVRAMFLDEAVIVLRRNRETNATLSVEGWIDDFQSFIENSIVVMGDIANTWVLYEARLPGRPPQQGVDNFSLIRRDGAWRIASIVNEVPFGDVAVPDFLGEDEPEE
jgi:hypothetical protein